MRAFDKKLRVVRMRCGLNRLLECFATALAVCGTIALLAVLLERLFALNLPVPQTLAALAAVGAATATTVWLRSFPSRMGAALLIDDRLGLRERFSTALALSANSDPFAQAAVEDAHLTAEHLSPQRNFPLRFPKRWAWTATAWTAAVLATLLPSADLLGYATRRDEHRRETEQLEQARTEVEHTSSRIESVVNRLDNPELARKVADLQKAMEKPKPADVRREAIRKLGSLAEELRKAGQNERFRTDRMLRRRLRHLKDTPEGLSRDLYLALARGQFAQAADMLSKMRQQIQDGELSPDQQQALGRQLEDLSRQLRELGDEDRAVREQLSRAGIDEDAAKLSQDELRRLLQNKGLSNEQTDELLKKLSACKSACQKCRNLSDQMGRCAGGSGGPNTDELASLLAQLNELERTQLQAEATASALAQIENEISHLGGAEEGTDGSGLALDSMSSTGGGAGLGPGYDRPPEEMDEDKFGLTERLSPSQTHGLGADDSRNRT